MTAIELAFERGGAHAVLLVSVLAGVALVFGVGRWRLGLLAVAAGTWIYVLGYLAYVRVRFARMRRERDWTRGQQFIAFGVIIANDSTVGTAPMPVVLAGVLGVFTTLGLAFTSIDFLALPTWALLGLVLPLAPLLLPLGWGRAAYRTQRYNDVVDLQLE